MYSTAVFKIDSASKIRANWLKISRNSAIFGQNSANFRQFTHINFNLFHYAGNNPVKYVDPDGREIFVDGDESYRANVLKDIQKLAPTAQYDKDRAGYIVVKGDAPQGYEEGTALIKELSESDKKVSVKYGFTMLYANKNESNGGVDVGYDPGAWYPTDNLIKSKKGTKVKNKSNPTFFALAHEFIHAYHYISESFDRTVVNNYTDLLGHQVSKNDMELGRPLLRDELLTIGIVAGSKFTENGIRREHNYPLRARY